MADRKSSNNASQTQMINLYRHQEDFIAALRLSLRKHQSAVGQAATGFGKTICAAYMASSAISKGKKIYFSVHRRELITQTAKSFDKFGIDFGYIAAGIPSDNSKQCQIVSIDTAKNRLPTMDVPDVAVIDEAHLSMATGWLKVINHWKDNGCKLVLLTATPWRLSGEGLGEIADDMVYGPPVSWLIERGYLSQYRYFCPPGPDLSGVKSRAGDYARNDLDTAMDKPSITGDVISHYRKLANEKRAVVFCVSVKHSQSVSEQFTAAGIPSAHIDGTTPPAERKEIIRRFADGDVKVLTNVEIITTGFDLSAQVDRDVPIEAVILLRPTQSLSLYLQMVGRGLRPKPDPAIILDHAGAALKHGLPDQHREWTLEGRTKEQRKFDEADIQMRQCGECFMCHPPAPQCPSCGYVYQTQGRTIEERAGELIELEKMQIKQDEQNETKQARTLQELIALAQKRKYKNPVKWAQYKLNGRKQAYARYRR